MMKDKNHLYKYLQSNGFAIVEQQISDYYGDYADLFIGHNFYLRFSSYKSSETVDISNVTDKDNWYDLALVKAILYKEKELNKETRIDDYTNFIERNLNAIIKLFSKENFPSTKKIVEELEDIRSQQMFPGKIQ